MVGTTVHHVPNSRDLAEEMLNVVNEEGNILNSHDFVSLFTCLPINKVLDIVKDRLEKGKVAQGLQ